MEVPALSLGDGKYRGVDRTFSKEEDRRNDFFKKWRDIKGFAATYRVLINALLGMKCGNDAGGVCELVKQSLPQHENSLQVNSETADESQPEDPLKVQCAQIQPEDSLRVQPEGSLSTTESQVVLKKVVAYCSYHAELKEELKLYCETCNQLICLRCALKGGKHHNHEYERYTKDITASLEPMEKQVVTAEEALVQIESRRREISDKRASTAGSIHDTFKRLQEVLSVRETELIGQLDQQTEEKLSGLAAQKGQIESVLDELQRCLHLMRESLKPGSEKDALTEKANTLNQVKDLSTRIAPEIFQPNREADISFSASADMVTECQSYGNVSQCTEKPVQCSVTGELSRKVLSSTKILTELSYEIYEPILTITGVRTPRGVAVNQKGELVVIEQDCVSLFSPRGEKIGSFDSSEPSAVAVGEGNIFVIDDHQIKKFTAAGKLLTAVGTYGRAPLQFSDRSGIAFNTSNNQVYVTDIKNHRIQVLNSDLTFSRAFGEKGTKDGQQ